MIAAGSGKKQEGSGGVYAYRVTFTAKGLYIFNFHFNEKLSEMNFIRIAEHKQVIKLFTIRFTETCFKFYQLFQSQLRMYRLPET